MAVSPAPNPATDRDLASVAEARALARRAKTAQATPRRTLPDSKSTPSSTQWPPPCGRTPRRSRRLAVEETGFGVVADKVQKNLFSSDRVHAFIRPMKTVGVINRFEDRRVIEIAEPFGVVAAIVPSTNPTSTAIYKILIALKARCAIVISPHPSAARCITRVAEIMAEAARGAGAPEGAIGWLTTVTLEGTQELMKQREVSVILATGGMGLVRAAYSAGKPAYGVGPATPRATSRRRPTWPRPPGTSCSARASTTACCAPRPTRWWSISLWPMRSTAQFQAQGGYFLSPAEAEVLAKALVTPQRLPNPAMVGKSALVIAEKLGIRVPPGTRALIARLQGVGRDHPLSIEKLCPVLSFYVVKDWREGCERCKQILDLRRDGPHDVDPFAERGRHPRVRPAQAGLPDLRQHADHARVHRADDRARPGDDAGVRWLRRQHHLGQHLAEAPAEHQAACVRTPAGNRQHPGRHDGAKATPVAAPASAARLWGLESTSICGRAGFAPGQAKTTPRRLLRPRDRPLARRPLSKSRSDSSVKTMSGRLSGPARQ